MALLGKIASRCALFLAVVSTCLGAPVMTRREFYEVDVGTSAKTLVEKYGEPYSIRSQKNGRQLYLYIERIPILEQTVEQNNYIFVIKNGEVVSKHYTRELPPNYDELYDDDPNDVPN